MTIEGGNRCRPRFRVILKLTTQPRSGASNCFEIAPLGARLMQSKQEVDRHRGAGGRFRISVVSDRNQQIFFIGGCREGAVRSNKSVEYAVRKQSRAVAPDPF